MLCKSLYSEIIFSLRVWLLGRKPKKTNLSVGRPLRDNAAVTALEPGIAITSKSASLKCLTSGTYVRTLVNDLGEYLGTYATAVELERTRIGEYTLQDAIKSAEISEDIDLNLKLIK